MSCNRGRWRALSSDQRDRWRQRTPPCCSWDSASYADKNCARDVGSLVRAAFETGSGRFFSAAPRALVPVGGNGCACNASREPLLAAELGGASRRHGKQRRDRRRSVAMTALLDEYGNELVAGR